MHMNDSFLQNLRSASLCRIRRVVTCAEAGVSHDCLRYSTIRIYSMPGMDLPSIDLVVRVKVNYRVLRYHVFESTLYTDVLTGKKM